MGKVNRVSNKRFAQTDAVCIEVAHLAAGVCVASRPHTVDPC